MNIHEYQGKALLKSAGVPVLEGVHCTSVNDALEAYDALGSKVVAVKSQIHAGGRGKGTMYNPDTREEVMQGGVKIAFSREEVESYASNILGNLLVTIQTGDEGKIVNNLYIESGCAIAHEYYLALLVDRESKDVLIMASTEVEWILRMLLIILLKRFTRSTSTLILDFLDSRKEIWEWH